MQAQKKKSSKKSKKLEEKELSIELEKDLEDNDDDEEYDNFNKVNRIEELANKNVNTKDIDTLINHGFVTIESIINESKHTLIKKNMKGMNDAKLEKIINICGEYKKKTFMKGSELFKIKNKEPKLNPGCESLKNLLKGGFEIGNITELFGEFRTGKTQLCLSAAVHCQLDPSKGGLGKKVIYIDTEYTFQTGRIISIANKLGIDPDEALDNIFISQIVTTDNLLKCLDQIGALILEEDIGLIIVDSPMHIFRGEYSGRGELSVRQNSLCVFLKKISKLAWIYKLVVIITNQMVAQVDGMTFGDNKKPVGGHIMAHASATRLYLRKGRGEIRICKIYDSPSLPESEAEYMITENGIDDVE